MKDQIRIDGKLYNLVPVEEKQITLENFNPSTDYAVSVHKGVPYILTRSEFESGQFKMRHVSSYFTDGSGTNAADTPKEVIESLPYEGTQFFDNWRDAFQYLLDNAN